MPIPVIPPLNGRFLSGYEPDVGPRRARRRRLDLQAAFPAAVRPELILGESNLLPFHFLRTGDRLGRAVVKIVRQDGACGTGFLVAPDVLLTNHHVLPDLATAAASLAVANYEAAPPGSGSRVLAIDGRLAPRRLFVTGGDLDFTFCGVVGLERLGVIPMFRDGESMAATDVVNIIQHPRGRPKEVAIQDNQVVKADHVVLHYICDTEPGSSGSPVFDNRWRLAALHHASIAADGPGGGLAGRGMDPRGRFLNEGVRLSAIAIALEAAENEDGADLRSLGRVRSLFRDLDPRAGFFGALGKSARTRPAAEVVVEVDRPGGETLDVGFWDLRALAPRLLDRLSDLGRAMIAMGMDVWCLAHLSAVHARALAEHLDTHFRREYEVLPDRASLAVLVRKSKAITAERVEEAGFDAVRLRVRGPADRVASIRVLPMPDGGPSAVAERVGAIAASRCDPSPGDWLLIGGPSARLEDDDLGALRASGLEPSTADGPEGGLVLLRSVRPGVARLLASPNLRARDGDGAIRDVRDRRLPDGTHRLAGRRPIAARLVMADRRAT